jgi:hypothetical protein
MQPLAYNMYTAICDLKLKMPMTATPRKGKGMPASDRLTDDVA